MDLFQNAKAVRLRSHHNKYLFAEEDEESVCQNRKGASHNARWTVEFVEGSNVIRLKSCYGRYLTASSMPFLLGMTGRKVLQTVPKRLDSSVEWEPVREGFQVRIKTRYGQFLRGNGGLPPWRNSVTHDIPQRTATQDWVLWDVDIVDIIVQSPRIVPFQNVSSPDAYGSSRTGSLSDLDAQTPSRAASLSDFDAQSPSPTASSPNLDAQAPSLTGSLLDLVDFDSTSGLTDSNLIPKLSKLQSNPSFTSSPKANGRIIGFSIVDDNGKIDDSFEGPSFSFKGNSVHELTLKLKEETGLGDIIVCSRSPVNQQLIPLRLRLPPNSLNMHVIVVPSSSKAAKAFAKREFAL
eukprot:TRINITY_DN17392_c0_g1_i1.p1 TRINITY_DN17392_c0_g1~~TRINITY_DN17392_c0_g1_i1.p1  ORF type:complete len:397 (-),score=43.59 TRINITY_DN17392_c0_g1_i1:255-1304(-)